MKNKIILTLILLLVFLVGKSQQNLSDYITLALKNNPSILVEQKKYEIEKEKITEVGTWNDTGFSFGYYPLTPETRVGQQITKVGISQEFPWFGTYEKQKDLQREKANLKQYDIALQKKEIVYKVENLYYEIYKRQANIKILKNNKLVLKIYENMALSALENNKASMSDVLKIRAEKNALHAKIYTQVHEIELLSKNFNRLLNRDAQTPLMIPDSLNATDILQRKYIVDNHPVIQKLEMYQEVLNKQQKLVRSQSKPKFKIGLDYVPVIARTDANPINNGKDIFMISAGLKIPIFNKKYKSQLRNIKLRQEAIKSEEEYRKLEFQSEYEKTETNFDNAMVNLMTTQKNIDDIQTAINVDLKAYETGKLNYDKILRLQLKKIKFELLAVQKTKEAFMARAKMKFLSGK